MARDAMRQVQAFQWQQRPDEPAERDIAVDPFSLRQFSRLDIDRPLPIPSVSVADPHVSPARFGSGHCHVQNARAPARSVMARDAMRQVQAFQWQQRPDEPAERDIAVDPFSLRQFSRLDIDRPLPIPSVSVADPHVSPARFGSGSGSFSAASSPRVSIAGRLNALAEATGWDYAVRSAMASPVPPAVAPPTSGKSTEELADDDGGFDVALSSSGRKASEPQRWGSDVPLMAAAAGADDEDSAGYYSFPNAARGRNGRGKARHAGDAPVGCCMYVPGLSRRNSKPPTPRPPPARSTSSSSATAAFGFATATAAAAAEKRYTAVAEDTVTEDPADAPGTARQSTVSLAVSLERFDCGSLSTSSWGDLDLDGDVSSSSRFDLLPLELILGCDDDDEADMPVCAAFVFDSDGVRRSVLKKRMMAAGGAGEEEARRPSLGRASMSMNASGRMSARYGRVSLKSRSPPPPMDALPVDVVELL
ncbi:hypothetical protein EJB05_12447, partial [Eragrostis curvula]